MTIAAYRGPIFVVGFPKSLHHAFRSAGYGSVQKQSREVYDGRVVNEQGGTGYGYLACFRYSRTILYAPRRKQMRAIARMAATARMRGTIGEVTGRD